MDTSESESEFEKDGETGRKIKVIPKIKKETNKFKDAELRSDDKSLEEEFDLTQSIGKNGEKEKIYSSSSESSSSESDNESSKSN